MNRDILYFIPGSSERQAELWNWKDDATGLHQFMPDYHRLQLEHWIWRRRHLFGHRVMDVGVEMPRRWVGPGYFTVGLQGCDIYGDLLSLPLEDESLDGAIVSEVLEHCSDPFMACREVHRVLKRGAVALITSPFLWPWHGTEVYQDYWRFSDQAWELLLRDFSTVVIEPCEWTDEGKFFYDMLRRFECMGHDALTKATTAYFCEAVK